MLHGNASIAHLEHPHIVRILDFGVEGNAPFLVMSYAPNGTLYPKGTRLPLATVVSYIKQIAPALQYAHDQRLIHRDVKPENMLLGSNNEVLLGDFGIAVSAHEEPSFTAQDMAGTIVYMAPEQIQGKPRPASDQYALARQMGHRERICVLLTNLGILARDQGDYTRAKGYFQEGLDVARQMGHQERTANLLANLNALTHS